MTKRLIYPNDEVMDIVGDIIGALLFARFKQFFDQVTDRVFSRGTRDARGDFLANISHELQTPIAILRGNVERLQRKEVTDAERASAERVIVSTLDGMSRLIGNVLESAKLKFSKKTLCEQDIFVGGLLRETHEDCLLLAEDKGIRLLVDITLGGEGGGEEESFSVRGDRDRLKEVLFNLISNALKHTAPGGDIILRAERAGAFAQIAVEDSGTGIAPEELPHIFERFYRIESDVFGSGRTAVPGTGIGLNLCREIVEAHGGKIIAESEVGKGSRFVICLPLSPPAFSASSASATAASHAISAIINS